MTASTDYLQRNNAAICITDRSNIVRHLEIIAENPDVVNEFAKNHGNVDAGIIRLRPYKKICIRIYLKL